jgi:hypothetical protein
MAAATLVRLMVLPMSLLVVAYDAESPVLCDAELNLFCPPSTSCCPTFKSKMEPNVIVGYSCLMSWSTRFPQGPCCPHYEEVDSDMTTSATGCAAGYECASSSTSSDFIGSGRRHTHNLEQNVDTPICMINSTAHPIDNKGNPINNKFETMPRYRACESFARDGLDVYGLPIPVAAVAYKNSLSSSSTAQDDSKEQYIGQLAYYSNMGHITADDRIDTDITTAVIGVHGSGRDAGTYLCALTAIVADVSKDHYYFTTKDQRRPLPKGNVLVVAPWFMAPEDNAPPTFSLPYIQWDDNYPIPHTFRYGAESIPDVKHNMTISSFGAMDVLLERLCNRTHFPNLRRIVVVGHSAGGQFVQRWALSSNSWCFGGGQYVHRWAPQNSDLPNVRVVVANPRSFAYLDNRRYFALSDQADAADDDEVSPADNDGTLTPFDKYELRPPSAAEKDDCKEFNKYEWGLDENEEVPAPYVINSVHKLIDHGDNSELFCRYASRDIVYLSGQRDVEKLGSQICYGKEDGYQGPSRRERSERFFASLQARGRELEFCGRIGGGATQVHARVVVENVGHDHGLMFQSPEGIRAMFR